jgi:quinoprotein glucose dehydrogenase
MQMRYLKKNIKIIIAIFIFVFAFIISNFLINLTINKQCKSSNILSSIIDLGISHIYDCSSIEGIKSNIKIALKENPLFYNFAKKIWDKNKYATGGENKQLLKISNNSSSNIFETNPELIKGIISYDDKNLNYQYQEDFGASEYNSWLRSHGGNLNLKYSDNKFINKDNIKNLKLIWKYQSIKSSDIKNKHKQNIELNPIYINKKIIFVTADWKIVALNALNGEKIWEIQTLFQPSRRGIVAEYDEKIQKEIVFFPIGGSIYKIDANNGKVIKSFGKNGSVKSTTIIAPIIYKDYILSLTYDSKSLVAFDKYTGNFLWSVALHPQRNFSGGAPWAGAAFDIKKGTVYVTTGNPQPSVYGANRSGPNKNSSSIIAISIEEKKIIWSFQETIHDLWDYDIASPPIIHNLKLNNNIYETIIAVTKRGNTLILDRNTGKPLFDINFKKAPKSDASGEISSPFQMDIKKPEPFSKIEYTKKDFNKLSVEKQKEIRKVFDKSKHGWFETPSFEKDLIIFGLHGGAEWQGAAIDPINQNLYIPTNNVPYIIRPYLTSLETETQFPKDLQSAYKIYENKCSSCHGVFRNGINSKNGEKKTKYIPSLVGYFVLPELKNQFPSHKNLLNKHQALNIDKEELLKLNQLFKFWDNKLLLNKEISVEANNNAWYEFLTSDGLPASNPPYGYIAKLDLTTGKINWKSPFGYKEVNGKLEKLGTENFGGLAVNAAGLIFATGTEDNKAYIYDTDNGNELWNFEMEAAGSAPPIIFLIEGKQYVSFLSTGGQYYNFKKKGSTLYTFSLN